MPDDTFTIGERTVHRIGYGAMRLPGAIPRTSAVAHLEGNVAAGSLGIDDDALGVLSAA